MVLMTLNSTQKTSSIRRENVKISRKNGAHQITSIHRDAVAAALELEAAWGPPPLTLLGYFGGN